MISGRLRLGVSMIDFSKNYFDLFGLPVGFQIDKGALADHYRDLQKLVHPDRFANASSAEQRLALQQATQVNEGFETLRDPLKRAQYLLLLLGVEAGGDNATTSDHDFLIQQMELREALAEAPQQADPLAELERLMAEIGGLIREQLAQLAVQFEDASPEQLHAARESVLRMQFLNKLHQEAEVLESRLEETS